MPYVHLANGETKHLDQKQMKEAFGDGTPLAYDDGGMQYLVIGVYPDGVKLAEPEPEPQSQSNPAEYGKVKKL